jgi:hypothetical protein
MPSLGLARLTATAIATLLLGVAAQSAVAKPPVVAINAPQRIVDDPKRPATMRVFDSQKREDYSGSIGIELRGYTSQQEDPKKPYAIETRKESGENDNVSLLGMPKDDDWVLIANYKDRSLLRNYVAYSTANWMGRYAARTRLVEVILNDSYEGIYLLAEDLKVHDDRVAVDDSDITGGYLLEMISNRRAAGEQFFSTPVRDEPVVWKDPNREDLSFGRAAWIRDYVNRFERRLYGDRFRNRRKGYRRSLDMGAAVDYALLNELFRNADTFRNSTYMHKGVDEKLVLGPIWDFDHAIGNDGTASDNATEGWEFNSSPWAGRLYEDPRFRRHMATRWKELRSRGLRRHIMQTIDGGASQLAGATDRNFSRWPNLGRGVKDPRTGAAPATYAQAVDYLKYWLRQRIRWIDANVIGAA